MKLIEVINELVKIQKLCDLHGREYPDVYVADERGAIDLVTSVNLTEISSELAVIIDGE